MNGYRTKKAMRVAKGRYQPRVKVVGLLPRQQHRLRHQLPDVSLSFLASDEATSRRDYARGDDLVIITRHADHRVWNAAIAAMGRDAVIRTQTTGVGSLVEVIRNIL